MNFKILPILLLICFALFAVSCVEKIVLDPMEEMPVVVNCVLIGEADMNAAGLSAGPQYVDLFRARRPSETGYEKISDASVRVVSGEERYDFVWNGERWECDFVPSSGREYQLMVKTADGKSISASTRFPEDIFLTGVLPPERDNIAGYVNMVRLYAAYYLSRKTSVGSFVPYEKEVFAWITSDNDADGQMVITTDHRGADGFNVVRGTWADFPFVDKWKEFEPSVDWWQEYASYCASEPLHKGFVRIYQPEGFQGSFPGELANYDYERGMQTLFTLCADFPSLAGNKYRVRFLSKEYDAYLRTIAKNQVHSDEFTSFYSLDEAPSNIQGGLGIFGAQRIVTCRIGFMM